jgi:hypothetical protein
VQELELEVEFLQLCKPRLAALIEAGVAGFRFVFALRNSGALIICCL